MKVCNMLFKRKDMRKSKYSILKAKDLVYRIEYYNNCISFIRIPRKLNYEAHFLAIKAIREYFKNRGIKILRKDVLKSF